MIAFVQGELCDVGEGTVIVSCQGVGYEIQVPDGVAGQLPDIGMPVKIYTYMYVREDNIGLYGFLTKNDLSLFKLLITVSGVGPKGALGILSALSAEELEMAILAEDVKTISQAPGIGAKTAGRLILDLKDKIDIDEMRASSEMPVSGRRTDKSHTADAAEVSARDDAVMALSALGYSNSVAVKAVRSVEWSENMTSEDILRSALKNIMIL